MTPAVIPTRAQNLPLLSTPDMSVVPSSFSWLRFVHISQAWIPNAVHHKKDDEKLHIIVALAVALSAVKLDRKGAGAG